MSVSVRCISTYRVSDLLTFLWQTIPMDIQMCILEQVVNATSINELPRVMGRILLVSRRINTFVKCKHSFWTRLGTHFSLGHIESAIVCAPVNPLWRLHFRFKDSGSPQWNRMMGLLHTAVSVTILSQPQQPMINNLTILPHPPCPLRRLILTGFRVWVVHLFKALSSHQPLESLHFTLHHIEPTFTTTCSLPNLTELCVGGHPSDIYRLGTLLTHPILNRIILEPRGKRSDIEGVTPHPLQLQFVDSVSVIGDMSWFTVNRYLELCETLTELSVEFTQDHNAHALLTDLAIRHRRPNLPQRLNSITVNPFESLLSVQHLLPILEAANPFLRVLSLGVDRIVPPLELGVAFCVNQIQSRAPKPLTICDDVGASRGGGISANARWGGASSQGWTGSGWGDSDEEPYRWDT